MAKLNFKSFCVYTSVSKKTKKKSMCERYLPTCSTQG